MGGVVRVGGKYWLYAAHPINSTGTDYSPMALAQAESPAGPWVRWPKNPVLREGPPVAGDHGGFSEAKVFYAEGTFHMFYGELHPERIRTRESIGYAFSRDGYSFQKHRAKPRRGARRALTRPRSPRSTRSTSRRSSTSITRFGT